MVKVGVKRQVLQSSKVINGKANDVILKKTAKGAKIELSEEDAIRLWGALDIDDNTKKILVKYSRMNGIKRVI